MDKPLGLDINGKSQTFPTSFFEVSKWAGVDDETAKKARNSRAPKIMVSGRLASGKDTIAIALMETLDHVESNKISFATALREELSLIIDLVKRYPDKKVAYQEVAAVTGLTVDQVMKTVDLVFSALNDSGDTTSFTRSKFIRLALQEWGTDVRRAVDPNYWVKLGAKAAITAMAEGKAVHITDARFINEVEIAKLLGFYTIRLVVSFPIREQRLFERDGLKIDMDAENHPSEVELDSYKKFDQWVSNDNSIDQTVRSVIQAFEYAFN
jgi:hypothetical protein